MDVPKIIVVTAQAAVADPAQLIREAASRDDHVKRSIMIGCGARQCSTRHVRGGRAVRRRPGRRHCVVISAIASAMGRDHAVRVSRRPIGSCSVRLIWRALPTSRDKIFGGTATGRPLLTSALPGPVVSGPDIPVFGSGWFALRLVLGAAPASRQAGLLDAEALRTALLAGTRNVASCCATRRFWRYPRDSDQRQRDRAWPDSAQRLAIEPS